MRMKMLIDFYFFFLAVKLDRISRSALDNKVLEQKGVKLEQIIYRNLSQV